MGIKYLLAMFVIFAPLAGVAKSPLAGETPLIKPGERIVFLGDSNTHAGHYISYLETMLRWKYPQKQWDLINLGLPSETASGLSEPAHPFPRPTVHERLDRCLAKTRPDVVFACYGMNDGIYYPFSEDKFRAYRDGILKLVQKVEESGARLILMTPPPFDPLPMKKQGKLKPAGEEQYAWFAIYENYDDVMKKYSDWIMLPRPGVMKTFDIRTTMLRYQSQKRAADPSFVMSGDGVHFNQEGHEVIARQLWAAAGFREPWTDDYPKALFKLVDDNQKMLHLAWLTHVGHKRPGVPKGIPLDQALAKSEAFVRKARRLGR